MDFTLEFILKEGQREFISMMDKQAFNFNVLLSQGKTCLCVCNRGDTVDELENFVERLSDLYPDLTITLLNIRCKDTMQKTDIRGIVYKTFSGMKIYDCELNDTNENGGADEWQGNLEGWSIILGNCKLKR